MEALVHQRKSLVLDLVKQTQNVASIFDGFSATESRKVSLNGNMYDFIVYYNSTDKFDIINIQSV